MSFCTFTLGPFETNSYVAFCPESREGIIIDPGFEVSVILAAVEREKLEILRILNTHGHIDHTFGNGEARQGTGAEVLIHREDLEIICDPHAELLLSLGLGNYTPAQPDGFVEDGHEIKFGEQSLRVIHTPGHTPGGICLLGEGLLFTGDTIFAGSVGRTDLFGGDQEVLLNSIREKILPLGDEMTILPGHGPATRVGTERHSNPFLG